MKRILVMLEVSQKQAYIFASKELKENASRSADIAYITGSEFFKEASELFYEERENLVYTGGGHAVLQFENVVLAQEFARDVTETVLRDYGGLELFAAQIVYDENKTPGENLKCLTQKLERKKSMRRNSFRQMSLGVEALDPRTFRLKRTEDPVRSHEPMESYRGYRYPASFDEVAGEDNFIAVVHLDGNAMGDRLGRIYESCTDWEDCCKSLRRFSEGVQQEFESAFREMVDVVIEQEAGAGDKKKLPLRPIILAGDDVCFVTRGNIGLECGRVLLEKLARRGYPACAGVAIVHQKYPFHRAYDLAEELCSSAKKFGYDQDRRSVISAMDWHIEFGQTKDSLSALREDYETDDGCRMELRPVNVVVPDGDCGIRSWGFFRSMCSFLQKNSGVVPRSKVKGLRQAIKQGEVETAFALRDKNLSGLYNFMPESMPERNVFYEQDGVKRCLLFDAIEMADHCTFFKEENHEE